ncbi:MAG: hypothetical protein HQL37_08690 [Alphaproteobacteria bacterium]|nr:hypothetical protein [Alphaproteobacteria bacterium]
MATKLPRMCITLNTRTYEVLTEISRLRKKPKASFITEILEENIATFELILDGLKNPSEQNKLALIKQGHKKINEFQEKEYEAIEAIANLSEKQEQ